MDDGPSCYLRTLMLLSSNNSTLIVLVLCAAIAKISPLFIEENRLFDENATLVATFSEISSPQQLEQLQPVYEHADNVIVDLLDWQVCSIIFNIYHLLCISILCTFVFFNFSVYADIYYCDISILMLVADDLSISVFGLNFSGRMQL